MVLDPSELRPDTRLVVSVPSPLPSRTVTYVITPLAQNSWWDTYIRKTVALPGAGVCYVVAGLNVAFMWIEVVSNSRKMKKKGGGGRTNIGHTAKVVVTIAGIVFCVLLCASLLQHEPCTSSLRFSFILHTPDVRIRAMRA